MTEISKTIEKKDGLKGKIETATKKQRARFLLAKCRRALEEMLNLRILEMPGRGRISYFKEQIETLEHRADQSPEEFFI